MRTIIIILLSLAFISCSPRIYVQKGYADKIEYVCNNGHSKALYFANFKICNYTGNAIQGDSVSVVYSTNRWGENNYLTEFKPKPNEK